MAVGTWPDVPINGINWPIFILYYNHLPRFYNLWNFFILLFAGKGAGSLVGGYLINAVTIRTTFQIFATSTAITGLIYIAFYHLYMKHRPSEGNDITKKDVEKPPKGFEDINLNSKPAANGNVEHEITPASYEEAVTNLAYEDTEMDQIEKELDKVEKENPVASKQNANPWVAAERGSLSLLSVFVNRCTYRKIRKYYSGHYE